MLLVAAFEPYGGSSINAAAQIAMLLPRKIYDVILKRVVLPCSSTHTPPLLARLAASPAVSGVLLIGEDDRYTVPTVELSARNRLDYRITDNEGQQPRQRAAIDGGPAIISTNIDLATLAHFAATRGVDIATSHDAGLHLCNHTYYFLRYHVAEKPGLLLHVSRTADVTRPSGAVTSEALRTARVLSEYLIGVG